jgi:hypothetical protein
MSSARHISIRTLNPRFSSTFAPYDAASSIHQSLQYGCEYRVLEEASESKAGAENPRGSFEGECDTELGQLVTAAYALKTARLI